MFEVVSKLAKRVFGDANERELRKLQPLVSRINELERTFEPLTDEQIVAKTNEFRQRIANGEGVDDLLPEAFATVREAAKRSMGMRHYDCQLIGGSVLHHGRIAEMKTGEGKTLTSTLPVYLNALSGKGVHVVTVNDYLAARDADWMRPIYGFLGLSVGKILSNERSDTIKRDAYAADITFGTNNEFGFDYLRDNMKFELDRYVQRGHHFAIVDEVDSILIDEARTPLIISGPMNASIELYAVIDSVIPTLQNEIDFIIDEKSRGVSLTDEGISRIEDRLGVDNLYDPRSIEVLHHVNQALKAHHVFKLDRDYVVREGKVVIVDEFTGRLMHGRRWSDGLHQAVEAKEKLNVEQESQVYATITFQNYFRMYDKLAGMTGTAITEASEFDNIYKLDCVAIPTNRTLARLDAEDIIYKTQMEKFRAVIEDIRGRHANGQPVLVGTTSVEKSEIVSRLLTRDGITHEILNAKNHHREAHIVAQAGRKGAITISTNMAGRGTDIKLGGNAEEMANSEVDQAAQPELWQTVFDRYEAQVKAEREEVLAAGGLHIIGTERHESRRVDNQLRGRSGRQGDPGSSRFYLSLEDDLLRIFGSDKISVWMERMGLQDDEPIEHRWISRAVENAQRKVEGHNFNIRKNLLEYDDVMNYQRKGVYELRRRALGGEGILSMVHESIDNVVGDIMDDFIFEGQHPESWKITGLRENLERVSSINWDDADEELRDLSRDQLRSRLTDAMRDKLEGIRQAIGENSFEQYARMLLLQYTDSLWKDHLLALDRLRQGVGLRGYGQRNPLLEYKREALQMYLMMGAMRDEMVLSQLFSQDPAIAQAAAAQASKSTARMLGAGTFKLPDAPTASDEDFDGDDGEYSADEPYIDDSELDNLPLAIPESGPGPVARPNVGAEAYAFGLMHGLKRNDPCPCGSGEKFKKCCWGVEGAALSSDSLNDPSAQHDPSAPDGSVAEPDQPAT